MIQPGKIAVDHGYAMLGAAAAPIRDSPALRERLADLKRSLEQTIDTVSQDTLLEAGFSTDAAERARALVGSFEKFVAEHRDEITALQVLYSQPYARRLRYGDVKALAAAIGAPPRSWTAEDLWRAYEALDRDRVRGAGARRLLTDIVSLVRFALRQDEELVPFGDRVRERFARWLAQQRSAGREFTAEQLRWLELMRDHIGASVQLELEDFEAVPFNQLGGLGRVYDLFGQELVPLLEELNEVLAA